MLKSLRLLCVVAFAAALGACGSETPPATSSTGTAAAPAEPAAPAAPSTPEPAVTAAPEPAAPEPAAPEPAAPEPAAPEAAAATAAAPAVAGVDGVDGEKVYGGLCVVCHGTGVAGAPMVGNKDDWAPRIAQGKDTLYKHALEGFTGQKGMMPPRGGNPSLKDEEVKAAVDFMVQKSS